MAVPIARFGPSAKHAVAVSVVRPVATPKLAIMKTQSKRQAGYLAAGIVLGVAIGVSLGNIAAGIGIGIALGIAARPKG